MINTVTESIIQPSSERQQGWSRVRKSLPKIVEYGITEGILHLPDSPAKKEQSIRDAVQVMHEEVQEKIAKNTDKVTLSTNDISLIHEAIPFLPLSVAISCMFLNVVIPGSGTMLSGVCVVCVGQPRINLKEGRRIATIIVNFLVGISQFFTVTFLLVGWFWSIAWGGLLIVHSLQYQEALQQRRQEAVATAAIEALTKDSILHRKDVKSLVKDYKIKMKSESREKCNDNDVVHNSVV